MNDIPLNAGRNHGEYRLSVRPKSTNAIARLNVLSAVLIGAATMTLTGCSPADAAKDQFQTQPQKLNSRASGLVNVHCEGRLATKSPMGDVTSRFLTSDYAIDERRERIFEYSIEDQKMKPIGATDLCRTSVSDKMGQVLCKASQPRPTGGLEVISTDTRIDRVLGKLRVDVQIQKSYQEGGELNAVTAMSVRADCSPGTDPTTVRKF